MMRKNQKHSEATISKIREDAESRYKRVIQLTKELGYVNDFVSITEAAERTGINDTGIRNCLNIRNSARSAGGYIWGYWSDFSEEGLRKIKTLSK